MIVLIASTHQEPIHELKMKSSDVEEWTTKQNKTEEQLLQAIQKFLFWVDLPLGFSDISMNSTQNTKLKYINRYI